MKSGLHPCIGWGFQQMAARRGAARVSLCGSDGQQLCIHRLTDDHLGLGPLHGEHTPHPFKRAARAKSGDPVIEGLAFEIGDDFPRGGARMHVSIGLIFELARQKPAMGFGKFDSLLDHAYRVGGRRDYHLGAQKAH